MRLGIDFGTTNTSAAIYDGHTLNYIPLDPHSSSAQNLRSMIYIDRKQRVRLGMDAVQTFLKEDTGRISVFEDKVVGTIENTVARQERGIGDVDDALTIVYDVTISEDVAIRGRLLQSIKTALRSSSFAGTQVFEKFYTVEQLIAFILTRVREQAQQQLGQPIDQALIGRPVTFSHDATTDRIAEEKIRRAAHLAGFADVEFATEPMAAATFYVNQSHKTETVFVFDFGGGTLDLTVLEANANGQQRILASHGVLLGGDDIDTAIMRGKVAPYFGSKSNIDFNFDGRPIPFPEHLADLLDQWHTIPTLTRQENHEIIKRGIQYGDNREGFAALDTLASKNYGFALFQKIEQAKCELSQQTLAQIVMHAENIHLQTELARQEFNAMIAQERTLVRQGIREAIAASGIHASQINAVVATGGSSSILTFQSLLKAEFPQAELIVSDIFGSVTGGLAMLAHERHKADA